MDPAPKIPAVCAYCSTGFLTHNYVIKSGKGSFCCARCSQLSRRKISERSSAIITRITVENEVCAEIQIKEANGRLIYLDLSDLDWFLDFPGGWKFLPVARGHYAAATRGNRHLHRYILHVEPPFIVDHKNGNRLDCRRNNLREVTPRQNSSNSNRKGFNSQFIGVRWVPYVAKWSGQIKDETGKRWTIGFFDKAETAALVRDAYANRIHGEYCRLNFPHRINEATALAADRLKKVDEWLNRESANV